MREIIVQIGRTGVLTPVAVMDPVSVGGVTVTHATLHNADEIDRLDLRTGDTVIISRAGDVIPQITKVLPELRTGKEKKFRMPARCPVDDSPVVRDGVAYRCSSPTCGARHLEQLRHFVSRGGFDIRGMGPKILDRFLDEGLIADAADIFMLQAGDIAALPQFGERSADKLVEEIKTKRTVPLERLIYSLGILHVGEETAIVLKAHFGRVARPKDLLQMKDAVSVERLMELPDIGPKVGASIAGWFREKRNHELLLKLDQAGVRVKQESGRKAGAGPLEGKTFVLTGTLSSLPRDEAKAKVRELGGDISESVSSKTDYVVVGAEPGSKYERAKELGVAILEESEFLRMLRQT